MKEFQNPLPTEWKNLHPTASPEKLLEWVLKEFSAEEVTLACSLGVEDMVLVDMWQKVGGKHVFVLDTGRLHQETYNALYAAQERYSLLTWSVLFPKHEAVEELVSKKGPNSFYFSVEARKECCHIRKVEPLTRVLSSYSAWITGLRRSQSITRAEMPAVQMGDPLESIVKLNPLLFWEEEDVWNYANAHHIPINLLHRKGYPSIGCVPCTKAIAKGEDLRSGRWWWEDPENKECGLHSNKT